MTKGRKEAPIQSEMLDGANEAFWGLWWRQNAGEVLTATGHNTYLGPEGISDIVGAPEGGAPLCFFEAKREKGGRHRKGQKQWQAWAEAADMVYVKANSKEQMLLEARDKIRAWWKRRGIDWEPAGDFETALRGA
jgi:hypothetical protein